MKNSSSSNNNATLDQTNGDRGIRAYDFFEYYITPYQTNFEAFVIIHHSLAIFN